MCQSLGQGFSNQSWRTPNTAHSACLHYLTHPHQVCYMRETSKMWTCLKTPAALVNSMIIFYELNYHQYVHLHVFRIAHFYQTKDPFFHESAEIECRSLHFCAQQITLICHNAQRCNILCNGSKSKFNAVINTFHEFHNLNSCNCKYIMTFFKRVPHVILHMQRYYPITVCLH